MKDYGVAEKYTIIKHACLMENMKLSTQHNIVICFTWETNVAPVLLWVLSITCNRVLYVDLL